MSAWQDFVSGWWQWIVPAALHATGVGLAAMTLERLAGRRLAPAYRAALWWLCFTCLLVPPSVVSPLALGSRELAERTAEGLVGPGAAGPSARIVSSLAALWLVGVALTALRTSRGARNGGKRLRAASQPAPPYLVREVARLAPGLRVELRLAPLASPVIQGWRHVTIYLPEALVERPRERSHALMHELAHAARRDPLRALVAETLCAAFWFHPLVWLGARRLALAREMACDASVAARLGHESDAYRVTLARAALERVDARALGALGFLGGARAVERLRALERRPRFAARIHGAAAALLFAAASLSIAPDSPGAEERAFARRALATARSGEHVSCFTLHAAAQVLLAADEDSIPDATPSPTP